MWDADSTLTLETALTLNYNDNTFPAAVRLVYLNGNGHEAVRPLLLDTEGGMLFIVGGEMRKLDTIASIEVV